MSTAKIIWAFFTFEEQLLAIEEMHTVSNPMNNKHLIHLPWHFKEACNPVMKPDGVVWESQCLPSSIILIMSTRLSLLQTDEQVHLKNQSPIIQDIYCIAVSQF